MNEIKYPLKMAQLHNHTDISQFRMLDCIIKVENLVKHAAKMGFNGVAITDHESVSGYVKAIQALKELKSSNKVDDNFKLILGNEIYLIDKLDYLEDGRPYCKTPFYHFILLAKDKIGCRQLRELSSLAWDNSFKTGKMERVPTLKKDLERIIKNNPGHIIAQNACAGGEIPQLILNISKTDNEDEKTQYLQKLDDMIYWLQNLFGEDFYFEIQPSDSEDQTIINEKLIYLSDFYNIKYVVTCDCHYLKKEDREIHAAYLNSRDEERETDEFYKYTYMMSPDEIHEILDGTLGKEVVDKAIATTLEVSNKVENYDLYHPTIVPEADIPDFKVSHFFKKEYDSHEYIKKYAYSENIYDRYLLKLIEDGYQKKVDYRNLTDEKHKEQIDRIEIELKEMWLVTEKISTSISSYYLTTLELINIMWNEGDSIVGPARGSVTGMYTMYLIDLIQVNPLEWALPHWRHISHEKAELSDVDIDSQANRRNQIIEAVKKVKGERKVLNCCTFKTEGSKSAIKTAGKGLGMLPEETDYIANMIPITRGFNWSLHDCLYGNEEEGRKPIKEFIDECAKYPKLLQVAMGIEGLICGRSIHASAVYLFNDDFLEHNARMKAPNGVYTTQFNMADSDYQSGLKMDFLTVENLDKIRHCMDMLVEAGYIKWQGSLRSTYDKYLHPDVLDYDTEEMWDWIGDNRCTDLFQFDTQVGLQSAKKIKPHSLVDLATANSVMRLMVSEEGAEQPIDTYIRYKNDLNEWYKDMNKYHLTDHEIEIMEKYLKSSFGVGATQEDVMEICMDPEVANFNVTQSNKLRKSISKKRKDLQQEMKEKVFDAGQKLGTSRNLLNYFWHEVVGKQLGYSFSKNHTTPYSIVGLQDLNLAYHYPIIYWNCACLIVNAGADEEIEDNKSTKYGKVASAIANIQKTGCHVARPTVNEAGFGFIPDEKNNEIIFSLKGIVGLGEDAAKAIIANRPFSSFEDFCEKMIDTKIISNSRMISLIKAGVFTKIDDENIKITMTKYLRRICKTVDKIGLQQLNKINEMDILSENLKIMVRYINFKKYVLSDEFVVAYYTDPTKKRIPKCGYHDRYIKLDSEAKDFFEEHFSEDSIIEVSGTTYIISEKKFEKEVDKKIDPLREWFSKPESISMYNQGLLHELQNKYAKGTVSKWEMDSLSYYYHEHELTLLNEEKYGVVNYFDQPEEPAIYDYYSRYIAGEKKWVPKYRIYRIAGTVLDNDKNKHMITLLTKYGVVHVKMQGGQYNYYAKQISEILPGDTKKTTLEGSWFKRGTLLMCAGYRRDDTFRCYRYSDTVYGHTVAKITEIYDNGDVLLTTERIKLGNEINEE